MNIAFLLQLIKSKTMQGIAITALGFVIENVKHLLTPAQLDQFNILITTISSTLQPGGLAWAAYGRLKAQGPLSPSPPSPTGGEATTYDGIGGELPK